MDQHSMAGEDMDEGSVGAMESLNMSQQIKQEYV